MGVFHGDCAESNQLFVVLWKRESAPYFEKTVGNLIHASFHKQVFFLFWDMSFLDHRILPGFFCSIQHCPITFLFVPSPFLNEFL